MIVSSSRQAIPLPFGRDARLSYRRLRRPTRLPDMTSRSLLSRWAHGVLDWLGLP